MADFGQNDEVVSKPSVSTPKSSWGNNDEVVSSAPTASASAPVEGAGGAAFGVYPKPGMKPMKEGETTSLGAAGAAAAESIAATPGALLGARAAMAVTPPVLPVVGPLAKPVAGIAGGIAGGVLGCLLYTSDAADE